mgnify:CR=1 FL=1
MRFGGGVTITAGICIGTTPTARGMCGRRHGAVYKKMKVSYNKERSCIRKIEKKFRMITELKGVPDTSISRNILRPHRLPGGVPCIHPFLLKFFKSNGKYL